MDALRVHHQGFLLGMPVCLRALLEAIVLVACGLARVNGDVVVGSAAPAKHLRRLGHHPVVLASYHFGRVSSVENVLNFFDSFLLLEMSLAQPFQNSLLLLFKPFGLAILFTNLDYL